MATDTVRELSAFSDDGLEIYVRVEERGRRIVIDPLACWLARDLGWIGGDATVVFYDPRGRGRSSVPGGDSFIGIEADVADLECVRRTLRIDRCDLLGWSYYAAVIAHYARAHPGVVERLLLVAPVPLRRDPHMLRAALHLAERMEKSIERAPRANAHSAGRRGRHFRRGGTGVTNRLDRGLARDPGPVWALPLAGAPRCLPAHRRSFPRGQAIGRGKS